MSYISKWNIQENTIILIDKHVYQNIPMAPKPNPMLFSQSKEPLHSHMLFNSANLQLAWWYPCCSVVCWICVHWMLNCDTIVRKHLSPKNSTNVHGEILAIGFLFKPIHTTNGLSPISAPIPLYDFIIIWNSFLSHMLSPISFYFFHQSHSIFSPITVYILLLYILMHSSSFYPNIIISFIVHVSDRSPSHLIETTPFPQHSYHVQLSQLTLGSLSNKYQ